MIEFVEGDHQRYYLFFAHLTDLFQGSQNSLVCRLLKEDLKVTNMKTENFTWSSKHKNEEEEKKDGLFKRKPLNVAKYQLLEKVEKSLICFGNVGIGRLLEAIDLSFFLWHSGTWKLSVFRMELTKHTYFLWILLPGFYTDNKQFTIIFDILWNIKYWNYGDLWEAW